jgi:hypothetical protein
MDCVFGQTPTAPPLSGLGEGKPLELLVPFFFDDDSGQEPTSLSPIAPTHQEMPLLKIVDLIAFVSRRTAIEERIPNGARFRRLLAALGPTIARFGIAPDGGLGFKVAN